MHLPATIQANAKFRGFLFTTGYYLIGVAAVTLLAQLRPQIRMCAPGPSFGLGLLLLLFGIGWACKNLLHILQQHDKQKAIGSLLAHGFVFASFVGWLLWLIR
jgi:hypothetical protein